MAAIYGHAYLTIIAAQGEAAEFGIRGIGSPLGYLFGHYIEAIDAFRPRISSKLL